MSKDIRVIREECCKIWNGLKDKTQMIDCLIESKQQIADLEAKLAESEVEIEGRKNLNYLRYKRLERQDKEIKELKQQLADKDKEIKALKYLCGCPNDINEMVRKVVYRDEQLCKQYDFFQGELKRKDQDKISFCIEQLEKVKEYWLKHEDVSYYIDNQVEELKKEHPNAD